MKRTTYIIIGLIAACFVVTATIIIITGLTGTSREYGIEQRFNGVITSRDIDTACTGLILEETGYRGFFPHHEKDRFTVNIVYKNDITTPSINYPEDLGNIMISTVKDNNLFVTFDWSKADTILAERANYNWSIYVEKPITIYWNRNLNSITSECGLIPITLNGFNIDSLSITGASDYDLINCDIAFMKCNTITEKGIDNNSYFNVIPTFTTRKSHIMTLENDGYTDITIFGDSLSKIGTINWNNLMREESRTISIYDIEVEKLTTNPGTSDIKVTSNNHMKITSNEL